MCRTPHSHGRARARPTVRNRAANVSRIWSLYASYAPLGAISNESLGKARAGQKMQMDVARENRAPSITFRRVSIRALNLVGHGIDHGITELMSADALARREPPFHF